MAIGSVATRGHVARRSWKQSAIGSWVTTVDHKRIGILYMYTAFVFFLMGGIEALLVRTQLAVPNNTVLSPQAYDEVFTMHATTMIFLFVMPLTTGLANYLVPRDCPRVCWVPPAAEPGVLGSPSGRVVPSSTRGCRG